MLWSGWWIKQAARLTAAQGVVVVVESVVDALAGAAGPGAKQTAGRQAGTCTADCGEVMQVNVAMV